MPTTSRGYVYPASTEHDRIWEHIQNLAASIDTDISAFAAAWSTYTPAWTSTGTAPSLGNGTLTGRYKQIGKTVICNIYALFGSTTTFGTGAYSLSLPVAAVATGNQIQVGSAQLTDVSAGSVGHLPGSCVIESGISTTTIGLYAASTGGRFTNTNPFTWVSTDWLAATLTYEAA